MFAIKMSIHSLNKKKIFTCHLRVLFNLGFNSFITSTNGPTMCQVLYSVLNTIENKTEIVSVLVEFTFQGNRLLTNNK